MQYLGTKRSMTYETRAVEIIRLQRITDQIVFVCDEVTAVCPVTGQPDLYVLKITLFHTRVTLESKSLKLYLMTLRNQGIFAEDLGHSIATDLFPYLAGDTGHLTIEVSQKSRGGISINVKSGYPMGLIDGNSDPDAVMEGSSELQFAAF